jgi:hypothetical protein
MVNWYRYSQRLVEMDAPGMAPPKDDWSNYLNIGHSFATDKKPIEEGMWIMELNEKTRELNLVTKDVPNGSDITHGHFLFKHRPIAKGRYERNEYFPNGILSLIFLDLSPKPKEEIMKKLYEKWPRAEIRNFT